MLFILPVVFALLPISAMSLFVTQRQLGQVQNVLQVDLPLDAEKINLFKRQVQDSKRKQPFSNEADGTENKRLQVQLERQSSIHSSAGSNHIESPPLSLSSKMSESRELTNAPPSPKIYHHTPTSSTPGHRENLIVKEVRGTILQGRTPNTEKQLSIPKLFSNEIIRSKFKERPKGYDTNENTIARAAETIIKNKKAPSHDKAIEMAKDKLEAKKIGNRENLRNWKHIASTDPSKAREMKTNVPKNMPEKLYVAARAYQLEHRGKAKDLEEATKLAKEEAAKAREYKKKDRSKL